MKKYYSKLLVTLYFLVGSPPKIADISKQHTYPASPEVSVFQKFHCIGLFFSL